MTTNIIHTHSPQNDSNDLDVQEKTFVNSLRLSKPDTTIPSRLICINISLNLQIFLNYFKDSNMNNQPTHILIKLNILYNFSTYL